MDQGILKNIFLTSIYQVPKNFPEKLKNIVEYLFRIENFVDISFEIIPPLFKTDGSYKTRENSNFLKNGKLVISVKIRNFSRSWMMKRTSPLESSHEI